MKKMANDTERIKEQMLGAMIGLSVGDALGVPVEFKSRDSLARNPVTGMRGYGTHKQPPGTWSDDTSMALCLLDSLANGLDHTDIMKKFLSWYKDDEYTPHGIRFDMGGGTRRALNRFARGTEPLQCGGITENDNGNGSLMRILPLAFYLRSRYGNNYTDNDGSYEIIHNVSSLTHAHKRSLIACGIYLTIAERILDGDDLNTGIRSGINKAKSYYEKREEFAEDLDHYRRLFLDKFADFNQDQIPSSGYVVDTLEASVWCLLNTGSYKECVLKGVNLGRDTDTTGAVAGGIAGIYYGYDAIPKEWIDETARTDYIKDLCDKLSGALTRAQA